MITDIERRSTPPIVLMRDDSACLMIDQYPCKVSSKIVELNSLSRKKFTHCLFKFTLTVNLVLMEIRSLHWKFLKRKMQGTSERKKSFCCNVVIGNRRIFLLVLLFVVLMSRCFTIHHPMYSEFISE